MGENGERERGNGRAISGAGRGEGATRGRGVARPGDHRQWRARAGRGEGGSSQGGRRGALTGGPHVSERGRKGIGARG
jgi:hypothetical protein